jgi:hypothetical protein
MFKACFDEGEIMVSNLLWFSLFFSVPVCLKEL